MVIVFLFFPAFFLFFNIRQRVFSLPFSRRLNQSVYFLFDLLLYKIYFQAKVQRTE